MKELEIIFYLVSLIIICIFFWYSWIYKQSVLKESQKVGIKLSNKIIFALALNISFPLACSIIIVGLIITQILTQGL